MIQTILLLLISLSVAFVATSSSYAFEHLSLTESEKSEAHLRNGSKGNLIELDIEAAKDHTTREPLILVHGLNGAPTDFADLVGRLEASSRYATYVMAYDDLHRHTRNSGIDLAEKLRELARPGSPHSVAPTLTIIGHSVGGIIVRRALNELTYGPRRGIELFQSIRFIAVDTPWHGYFGPAERGLIGGLFQLFVAPFIPDGIPDMRSRSRLLAGNAKANNPADRLGLSYFPLDGRVSELLYFAQEGSQALDYTDAIFLPLIEKIVVHFNSGGSVPITGKPEAMNFWMALKWTDQFGKFSQEMKANAPALNIAQVLEALNKYFPRFPGNHLSVLNEQPGTHTLLEELATHLKL